MHRDHPLAVAVERDLVDAWIIAVQARARHAGLLGGDQQCRLGRVPEDGFAAVRAVDPGVVAQRTDAECEAQAGVGAGIDAPASGPRNSPAGA